MVGLVPMEWRYRGPVTGKIAPYLKDYVYGKRGHTGTIVDMEIRQIKIKVSFYEV